MAGRLAGHQDAPGPGRACGEPGRGGTRPRPEAGTRDHPGQAAWSTRPGPAACSPRKGSAPGRPWTGRGRPSPSPTPSPDQQNSRAVPDRAEPGHLADDPRTGPAPTRNRGGKIAVVPDNARPHHAKALTGLHEPGRLLERITTIFLPPYAPDRVPVEHVRNAAKNSTATIQHETPEETFETFASYVTGRTVDHDSEHPHPRNQKRSCFMTAIATAPLMQFLTPTSEVR